MKYLATDVETLSSRIKGPSKVLQFSAVVEDTLNQLPLDQLPHFTCFVAQEEYAGEPGALAINAWILKELEAWQRTRFRPTKAATKYPVYFEREFIRPLRLFLDANFGTDSKITLAGKNVGNFDLQFFPSDIHDWFRAMILDVGNFYVRWGRSRIPSMDEIAEYLKLPKLEVHDAYHCNLRVIEMFRATGYRDWDMPANPVPSPTPQT